MEGKTLDDIYADLKIIETGEAKFVPNRCPAIQDPLADVKKCIEKYDKLFDVVMKAYRRKKWKGAIR